MKKILALITALAMSTVLFAGCGNNDDTGATDDSSTQMSTGDNAGNAGAGNTAGNNNSGAGNTAGDNGNTVGGGDTDGDGVVGDVVDDAGDAVDDIVSGAENAGGNNTAN